MKNNIESFKIALLSDPHLSDTNENLFIQWESALHAAKNQNPDIYLIAGDLTEKGSANEALMFKKSIEELDKPCLFVPGNHDIGNKKLNNTAGEISSETIQSYHTHFGPDYGFEVHFGYQFIYLNSQLFQSGLAEETKQLEFFQRQLEQNHPTFVLMHAPLFLNTIDEEGGGYWNAEPQSRKVLLDLINQSNVRAVFSGHIHRLIVNATKTLFISAPPLSFGLPHFHLGQSFLTIDVSEDNLHWEVHQIEGLYQKK